MICISALILRRFGAFAKTLAAAALSGAVLLGPAPAAASFLVSPLRLVLNPESPSDRFEISNPSQRIVDISASWLDLTTTEVGYTPALAAERSAISAAPYLVVSPASLRLAPGERAEVTVSVHEGAAIPNEERRSHLLFTSSAVRTALRKAGGGLEADIGLAISTPVILRPRPVSAQSRPKPRARIGKTELTRSEDGGLDLVTSIERRGPFSLYGRLDVVLKEDRKDVAESVLATLQNAAVYTDSPTQTFRLPLGVRALPEGVLTVRYEGAAEYEGRTLARKSFNVAPPAPPK